MGADPKSCFLVDEVSEQGAILRNSRRLWPQAELIKAQVVQYDATGVQIHLDQADTVARELFKSYFATVPSTGTWRDCFDLKGNFVATAIPSSSNYHLWTAVVELITRPSLFIAS